MKNFCSKKYKEIKKVSDLYPVLFQEVKKDFVVYEVCRGEKETEFLRYDLTLIHPHLLNQELPKTFGHYHLKNEPELYEVVEGKALFLLQSFRKNPLFIEEVYLIEAHKGEQVVVLPNFGMVSFNPLNRKIILGNWVAKTVINDYQLFKKTKGACYYLLKKGKDWELIRNSLYQQVPPVVFLKPKPLPQELINLDFLLNPSKFQFALTFDQLYYRI